MFRPGLPEGFGDRAAQLGPNALGYSALFLWPYSLTATTVSPPSLTPTNHHLTESFQNKLTVTNRCHPHHSHIT